MLKQFNDYLNDKVGKCIYLWGGQGEKGSEITEALIKRKENSSANVNRVLAFWKELKKTVDPNEIEAYDCSGIAIHFLKDIAGVIKSDMTADGLMGKCTKISRSQLKNGDWVFKVDSNGKATHIGYVVDDALNVVEAKGRDHGVVESNVSKNSWNAYGRPPYFKADLEADNPPIFIRAATCTGDGVNIRKGRNTGTESQGKVNNGHPLVVGETTNNWTRVATLINEKPIGGYIFADYVSK